jgi:hypothetical protein
MRTSILGSLSDSFPVRMSSLLSPLFGPSVVDVVDVVVVVGVVVEVDVVDVVVEVVVDVVRGVVLVVETFVVFPPTILQVPLGTHIQGSFGFWVVLGLKKSFCLK